MKHSVHLSSPTQWSPLAKTGAVVLLALLFILATGWIDGGPGIAVHEFWAAPAWAHWWDAPWRMFANAVPGLLLALLLLFAIRKAILAFLLAFGAEALLYGVNALKVANLGSPLMPADFQMVGQMGDGGGELLSGYLPHSVGPYLLIAAAIALLVALIRYEPPLLQKRARRTRLVGGAATVALLGTLLAGASAWSVIYSRTALGMQPWSAKATARHTGLVSSLMLFRLQYSAGRDKPNVADALQMMASYDPAIQRAKHTDNAAADNDGKPDIVVILSESFFDPTILNGYPKGTDFMPNLRRLAKHGVSGEMHSPTFGGGTIRTEFEVLTGLPLRYFPDIQFPYLQIHAKSIPGIVHLLKDNGYQTLAVHGGEAGFWNRVTAFKALGFDKFIAQDQFPANDAVQDGKYMSDKSFTDELLRQLPDDGPPRFVLGISIEAHGPYDQDYGIDTKVRDAIPVPPSITGSARTQLQNYIYHIRHADQQLGRLADTLAKRKRPTLIVFFGDHLPAIVPAFQQAGFRNGQGFLVQTVPYLLIDTSRLKTAKPVQKNVAAWELPGMLLARTSIHDNYFALTQLVAPQLAALTRAPDAPPPEEDATQKTLDKGMTNIARLRLKGKLDDGLWAKAAAMAPQDAPTPPSTDGQQAAAGAESGTGAGTVQPQAATTPHASSYP
ncbi:LTA synthase family protein [Oleiagrimonas soli]|uniref:Phosphoglycerol transferase MdoB-like AlkP superfamily enzyme n=1 Tax=Oleiagrimonas soli TaxID=1543381 RepID=A0A841KHK9_9GAMM|nr:LTA synthase family protein [Oleiagrimonas soli]MBB6184460.1 phosphoglycerol transferase MdoB-like AlkP superfamily enzyme [Oleiagrimonas soli]